MDVCSVTFPMKKSIEKSKDENGEKRSDGAPESTPCISNKKRLANCNRSKGVSKVERKRVLKSNKNSEKFVNC